jgi:DNA polymerase
MGALEQGLQEEELQGIVDRWRAANPNIVQFWRQIDRAVIKTIKERRGCVVRGIGFRYKSGMLFIQLPSGRVLSYVRPRIGTNRFGGESVLYQGVHSMTHKWCEIESYGAKFVENIVQATARDLLLFSMLMFRVAGYDIVGHVHDEVILEAPMHYTVGNAVAVMHKMPEWAQGLSLRAAGYECQYYKKD